ncbi:MAG: phage head closure protein [Phyllobacteriaceae bacterium]|nr:phage head closure protein [Phyllobacteriaceae bacterium]
MARIAIDPGRLRAFARLEAAMPTPDGAGGHNENWAAVATVRLLLEPLAARSDYSAEQLRETATHRAIFRARDDVSSGMRFIVRARPMAILAIHDMDETATHLVAVLQETGR